MFGRLREWLGELPPEMREVATAAALLGIGLFRFFKIAYREWYGREGSDALIERALMNYLYSRRPPAWVRHFARRLKRLDAEGAFDRRAFGLTPPPRETMSPGAFRFWNAVIFGGSIASIFVVVPLLRALWMG